MNGCQPSCRVPNVLDMIVRETSEKRNGDPWSEKTIGRIESWLNADQHLRILKAVGSPAVQVYCGVANMELRGYDIYRESGSLLDTDKRSLA